MNILVLNCGSSSLKFQLIVTDRQNIVANSDRRLAQGQIERVGGAAVVTFNSASGTFFRSAEPIKDMRTAVEKVLRWTHRKNRPSTK